jgi:hypothetical protein
MNRGDLREPIFSGDTDRVEAFRHELLGQMIERMAAEHYGWERAGPAETKVHCGI